MTISVELDVSSDWNSASDWQKIADESVKAAIAQTPQAPMNTESYIASISVKLSDDDEVQKLNASFRGKDKPTNVLSFPMVQQDLLEGLTNSDDGEILIGDLILSQQTCAHEAAEKNIPVEQHAAHLIVHGTLHLLGYDHEAGEAEAEIMEGLEIKALASMGIADPY